MNQSDKKCIRWHLGQIEVLKKQIEVHLKKIKELTGWKLKILLTISEHNKKVIVNLKQPKLDVTNSSNKEETKV